MSDTPIGTTRADATIIRMQGEGAVTLDRDEQHALLALISDLRREAGYMKANTGRWRVEIDEKRREHAHAVSACRGAENRAHNAEEREKIATRDRREAEDLLRNVEQALRGDVEVEAERAVLKAIGEYLDRRNPERRG